MIEKMSCGKRVYIAGPYSSGDVAVNVRQAIDAADQLILGGFVPFVPHLTHFWHLIYAHDIGVWHDYDREWLPMCDAVLRLPGESVGACTEVALAESLGIPVFYTIEEVQKYERQR